MILSANSGRRTHQPNQIGFEFARGLPGLEGHVRPFREVVEPAVTDGAPAKGVRLSVLPDDRAQPSAAVEAGDWSRHEIKPLPPIPALQTRGTRAGKHAGPTTGA